MKYPKDPSCRPGVVFTDQQRAVIATLQQAEAEINRRMMQLAQLEGLALDAQIMGDAPGQTIAKGVTPMQLSYHLAPVPLCCYNGHNTVYAIMGRDAASQGQIEGWTHWCATCQQLVMTDTEAHAAMHAPGSDSIGFVTGVSFPMEITAP